MSRTQEMPSSSATVEQSDVTDSLGQVVVKLKKPANKKVVKWTADTIDNENMNKRKSKCCCIYKKPKVNFDDSSSESENDCENCFGHVEVKKAHQEAHTDKPLPSPLPEPMATEPS